MFFMVLLLLEASIRVLSLIENLRTVAIRGFRYNVTVKHSLMIVESVQVSNSRTVMQLTCPELTGKLADKLVSIAYFNRLSDIHKLQS